MPEVLHVKVGAYFSSTISDVIYAWGEGSIRRGVFSEVYTDRHTHGKCNALKIHCPLSIVPSCKADKTEHYYTKWIEFQP